MLSIAALGALTLLASCGSGDDGADSADAEAADAEASETTESTTPTTSATTAPPTTESVATTATPSPAEAVASFTTCMSNAGVELTELELGEDGLVSIGQLLTALDIQDTQTQFALFGCQSSLDAATGGGIAQLLASPALQQTLDEISACVRDAGYDVPDLTVATALSGLLSGGGAGTTDALLATAFGLDASDPDVLVATGGCAGDIEQQLSDLGLG